MKPRVGLITIGQAPRVDVVPDMAELIGPGVEIVERGALDGLSRGQIAALEPREGDEVLVTRLLDGSGVFLGKERITPLVQQRIDDLAAHDVSMTVVLCTGAFTGLTATHPLVVPERILVGVLRGIAFEGRLGVLTPSTRHVPQTEARWRGHGFDPVVVALSPYDHGSDAISAEPFKAGGVGLVLLDCMGFRREARRQLQEALGVPLIVANLLVARVVGEALGG